MPLLHANEFTEAFNQKRPGYFGYVDTPARIYMPNNAVIEGEIRQTPRAYHFDFFPNDKNKFREAGIALGAPYATASRKNKRKIIVQYNPGIPIIFEVDYPDGQMRTWAILFMKQDKVVAYMIYYPHSSFRFEAVAENKNEPFIIPQSNAYLYVRDDLTKNYPAVVLSYTNEP